jgi:hypothetical protein
MNSRFYPYATDSKERSTLAYWFAVASVAGAYAISAGVGAIKLHLPWWLALPTPMALYLIIRSAFARYAWRMKIFRRLGIVKIPDLNGTYKGHLWSSHDATDKHLCTLVISQTWTDISIQGKFPKSTSFNMVTGISVEGTAAPRLTYEYWNEPSSDAPESMHAHRGTIWLDIIFDERTIDLKGDYYTGRGRENIGRIEVRQQLK